LPVSHSIFGLASLNAVEASLLCAVVAAVIAVWGVVTQRIVARRRATLDYLVRVGTDNDLIMARDKFAELTKIEGGLTKWAEPQYLGNPEVSAIRLVLNENERLAIAIQFGILDIEFVKRHMQSVLVQDWALAAPFIMAIRHQRQNDAIFHEFEDLVGKLRANKLPRRSYWWKLWF
jgi:Domain of unknown function (DUF4760)